MSRLVRILIAESPQSPMVTRTTVRLVPARGVEGDRYHDGVGTFSPHSHKPDFEVTLIESEQIAEFARVSGLPFTAEMARRNLVTEGVDLNALVGKEFFVGEVRLLGMRLCEPCHYLAKTTFPEVLAGLVHRGGLRARIVTEGDVRVGDDVRVHQP
jgi:MOSC domain-containing protein YiiM